jgi:hypothetical protein
MGESCFAEARGSAKEKVIEGLRSGAGGVDQDAEAVFQFGLSCEIGEA